MPRCRGQLPGPGVLEQTLKECGFTDVEVHRISAPVRMASADECIRWRRETSGTLQHMLIGLSEVKQQDIWREIGLEFQKLEGPSGFESPCELLAAVGVKGQ